MPGTRLVSRHCDLRCLPAANGRSIKRISLKGETKRRIYARSEKRDVSVKREETGKKGGEEHQVR